MVKMSPASTGDAGSMAGLGRSTCHVTAAPVLWRPGAETAEPTRHGCGSL